MRTLIMLIATLVLAAAVHAAEPLDILVYGATGKVGSLTVSEALDRGHRVTAVSRDPARIEARHPNLVAEQGDLLDSDSIARLAAGKDVIILSVRGMAGAKKSGENTIQRVGIENVVGVLRAMGADAPRVIHVGGAGTLEVEPGVRYADKLPRLFIPKSLELEVEGQILALDYLRGVDDVKWSYATPAKSFTSGERTGQFRIGGDQAMEDDRGKSRISRADFAVALIDEAENAEHLNARFSVAY